MNNVEKFVAGIIAIGLVTAFGLHAQGLANLAGAAGKAGSRLESTAIKGG